jgi:pimeloyl-ACP methyl ester carboxylesterase
MLRGCSAFLGRLLAALRRIGRAVGLICAVLVLSVIGGPKFTVVEAQRAQTPPAEVGDGFVAATANANATALHYVRGGRGPAVVLLHGFPQDWRAFREIMPRLAQRFTVVVPDMRGIGGSAPAVDGYDIETLAGDVYELGQELGIDDIYVVGHDNGGMVAYALARSHPEFVRGVMILDVPLPGIEPWDSIKTDQTLWHFGFHQTPDLPEQLIAGREFVYFRSFFDRLALRGDAISDAEVTEYVSAYATPEQLLAGLAVYRRGYPSSEAFNSSQREAITLPIVLAGGDRSLAPINHVIAEALRSHGWADVTLAAIENSGHWVVDEQPAQVAELIERHAARGLP